MLIRPDVLLDEAGAAQEAWVPDARGKLVPVAREGRPTLARILCIGPLVLKNGILKEALSQKF